MENYLFGIRPLEEFLESGKRPEKVYLQKGLRGNNFQRLFSLIRKEGIPFQYVPAERLEKYTGKNHQGVVAIVPVIEYQLLETVLPSVYDSGETPLLVILDGVTDVRNMGAIARTAECAGAHALILPEKGGAAVNADAIKASAGALSRLPVCRSSRLIETIVFLKECGISVVVFDDNGEDSLYQTSLNSPLAVVMGAEDRGVSRQISRLADHTAFIPMKGDIASLNVSVATGVVLFEAQRQRMGRGANIK